MTRKILHYEIVRKIGSGPYGTVYEAFEEDRQQPLVIKVLHENIAGNNDLREACLKSLTKAGRLNHDGICPIQAIEEDQGMLAVVSRYQKGNTLKELMDQGPLTSKQVLYIMSSVASALEYAHKRYNYHGNLKPSNIIVGSRGRTSLLDFGFGRCHRNLEGNSPDSFLVDQLAYMSPEKISGNTGDQQSDLYSIGVIMYQALTGRLPFEAGTPEDIKVLILKGEPDFGLLKQVGVPGELILLIEELLSKRAQDRCQSVSELLATIRAIRQFDRSLPEEETHMSKISPRLYILISLVFVLLLILWSYIAGRQ